MGRVSIWEDGPILEKCGGDGGSTLGMNLMPLSRTVKNSKFYAHILPQILKWQKKKDKKAGNSRIYGIIATSQNTTHF